ncbi:probable JmjC domain-containing histone demethylation protein 2C isoform X2 [Argiope bruennichi]|uniref:[histone H3]-dimethyl-L-lysine(9) demethylase n=1 Tax=Argiope bruennichi TaxID=94029 RepID=A0A8T0FHW5_ARGBR|nr:probable JmjC domain-containing histone demethylation protein 2C isoform X2 [Argiope bruennichi]KAF8790844.1 Lysine-specific demethylase 3B like protein [Argiope bruennichi]
MSHLNTSDQCKGAQSYVTSHTSQGYVNTDLEGYARAHHDEGYRENLSSREVRESFSSRDVRESFLSREARESFSSRDVRESFLSREARESFLSREARESFLSREVRESLASREASLSSREARESLASREASLASREAILSSREARESLSREARESLSSREVRESFSSREARDIRHRRDLSQYRALSSGSRHPEYPAQESMNPATAASHPAAVASAAAVYPRVAILPQQGRTTGPPSHFETFGLSPHIPLNPPSATSGHHPATVHSSTYRHLLPPPALLPAQFSSASGSSHVGLDVMWQQKLGTNPWLLSHYEDMRVERERSLAHERERSRPQERDRNIGHERDRSMAHERYAQERQRNIANERVLAQERERTGTHERERSLVHDREREQERIERQKEERAAQREQREWQEQERFDREERERAQREAVQQHFEESLRLFHKQKAMGWTPLSTSKNIGKGPEINSSDLQSSVLCNEDRLRDHDKERPQYMESSQAHREHERWLAMVQQQRNEQSANMSLQNFSPVESRVPRNSSKTEAPQIPGQGSSKSSLAQSSIGSIHQQLKNETNFSLYGYQPFQHTYITHAQLKAREETKGSGSAPQVRVSGSMPMKTSLPTKGEKESFAERPLTPNPGHTGSHTSKHQLKVGHSGQERGGIIYQPLVGSGGAFKPYEYSSNSSSPAPPAHQNTSPAVGRIGPSHYQQVQDQPQNLVKGDIKAVMDKMNMGSKYDQRDSKPVVCSTNTLPARFSPPYSTSKSTSPVANSSYSYNLIQQGLVPNPMYIAATHTGNANSSTPPVSLVHSQSSSKASARPGSPVLSQQYSHASPNSSISSSSPICRPNSAPYTIPPGRIGRSYSPLSPFSSLPGTVNSGKIITQDSHLSNRAHVTVQIPSHRSPSPAHLYGAQSNSGAPNSPHQLSPRLASVSNHLSVHLPVYNSSSPLHSKSQSDSLEMSGIPFVKRKLLNDIASQKHQKSIDDGLLPPQLLPQTQTSCMDACETQIIITPPQLVSNAPMLSEHHLSTDTFNLKSNPPSPVVASNLTYKPEPVTPPPPMPDLRISPMTQFEPRSDVDHSSDAQNYFNSLMKYKIPNKKPVDSEDSVDFYNSSHALNVSDRTAILPSTSMDSSEEQFCNSSNATVTNSSNSTNSNFNNNICHTKLKKAWLQRHSENEDKIDNTVDVNVEPQCDIKNELPETIPEDPKPGPSQSVENSICDKNTSSDNKIETPKLEPILEEDTSSSLSDAECAAKSGKRKKNSKNKNLSVIIKRPKTGNGPDDIGDDQPSTSKKHKDKKKSSRSDKESGHHHGRKRGRKSKGRHEDSDKKKGSSKGVAVKPPEKPSVAQLKKTGEPFLQDGPCCEVAPRLPKCRECRLTPHQRSKKDSNIFCRFYAYRKLRYGKNGTILSAGFSEPSDALEEDLKLWLPPTDIRPQENEIEISKFLLTHIGDQFCDLVEMEREAQKMHAGSETTVTWKRVVQGVREMCDVCEATLFNIHWVCHKCGFVVCIDCYKSRKSGLPKDETSSKDRDDYHWLLCSNRQPHELEKLMLTQIIAGTALWDVGKALHEIRRKWNIPTYCNCGLYDNDQDSKSSTNGICKLMSAVTKCFSSDKDSSREANGSSDYQRSSKRSNKSSVNGVIKQEDGLGGYSSESGGSPLSWLADVALNSSNKASDDQREIDDEDKSSEDQESSADVTGESDDEKNENFSTLRELLIRPTGKMGGKNCSGSSSSQKTLTSTLDEVISCVIEQKVRKSDKKNNEKQLLHFTRRYQMTKSGRDLPPVRTCMLTESSLLYPEIPHLWLGTGKILLLKDPFHTGNMQLFQEQWKRGQPVIVADVGKNLDPSLWSPESFLKEFGESKTDFLNCVGGTLIQDQPMKKFWEGFDNLNKRIKDDDGQSLILKLLNWPPADEFSNILPSRYEDLMKNLPLRQYTHREGMFNMASRLPECFIQPDLGPRMYNAYGISSSFGKGSTNLHLDVSDAVNVLAYVAIPRDGKDELSSEVLKILEECGCDSLMKKRAKEKGSKPGAVWHVYNSRDADKIRDFLNKVSEEQGVKLNPHHDPIHNQEWYLDEKLRTRLYKEYGVEPYTIAQCFGDAILIPAGSPHQVINLHSCVKVAEDFVSPESVGHSFFLTQEIRNLSDSVINIEDRLQIKNIIYHAVKDALALLQSHDPEDPKT